MTSMKYDWHPQTQTAAKLIFLAEEREIWHFEDELERTEI